MADKLIVAIMRGPSPANARAVLVSDHEEVARRTVEIIREILEPGEAFDRALGEAGGGMLRVHSQLERRERERLARKRVELAP